VENSSDELNYTMGETVFDIHEVRWQFPRNSCEMSQADCA
jgi:hypothetical protein